jgi:hypothetical protein
MSTNLTIRSGLIGVNPANVNLESTPQDFELIFPTDLAFIFDKLKSTLAVVNFYDKLIPTPADPNCVMIESVGTEYNPQDSTRSVSFRIWILKPRSDQDTGQNSFSATYTAIRILRLLADNDILGGFCGITEVTALSAVYGSDFSELFPELAAYVDGGTVDITYSLIDTSLSPAG